ncbi:MAG: iron-containing alcohol dehydrogenase [Erysipelotrichaceae bacterium]|nr:iron-containing alcohol dehydrogenase [Erysipelotrichaceae bacterium]
MKYYMPTRLITGKDVLINNKQLFTEYGNRCLIVTGKTSAVKSGALNDIENILRELSIDYLVYNDIRQNPTVSSCMEAGRLAYANKCDFIIGIGGGSPLDAAKAAAIFAANPDLDEEGMYKSQYSKVLPIICIGTTAGTGSEVTMVSVLTNSKGLKKSIHHELLYPVLSFSDPKYTMDLPYNVTVSTAVDAFAHLLESYCSKKSNDITRSFSLNGCSMIYPILLKLKDETYKPTYEEREILYNASILGGMAIAETGTCFPHTMGYYLSETYDIPHGFACAVYMEDIIEHIHSYDKEYSDKLFDYIGISYDECIETVNSLIPDYDIKMSEEEIQSILPRYINNNSVKNTLGEISIEDIEKIIRRHFN